MSETWPLPESAGTFTAEALATRECRQCKKFTAHREQRWESNCGGYTDHKYTCLTCNAVHWVDGPDA